ATKVSAPLWSRHSLCPPRSAPPQLSAAHFVGDARPELIARCTRRVVVLASRSAPRGSGRRGLVERLLSLHALDPESREEDAVQITDFHVGDLDGDAAPDAVAAMLRLGGDDASAEGRLHWVRQVRPGVFARRRTLTRRAVSVMTLAQLDTRPGLDVAALPLADLRSGDTSRELTLVAGGRRPRISGALALTEAGLAVAAADLNRDGHMDLLVLGSEGRQLLWLRAQADSGFAAAEVLPLACAAQHLRVADVDGDSAADVLLACERRLLLWRARRGALESESLAIGSPIVTLVASDVDLDGVAEVLLLHPQGISAVTYRASQLRRHTPTLRFGNFGFRPHALTVADFDGDGRSDLALAGEQKGDEGWQLWLIASAFPPRPLPNTLPDLQPIAAAPLSIEVPLR
ncbi:MAG: FG-GAP repeat domain-containing protein, partial [Polyangiales bacterium]